MTLLDFIDKRAGGLAVLAVVAMLVALIALEIWANRSR